jgi:hypothetical protein
MKGYRSHAATAMAAALVLTAWTSSSHAEQASDDSLQSPEAASPPPPIVVSQESAPRDVITKEEKMPNAGLITGGALMFGIPYASSVIVAASSARAGDQHLYIPVAGPWLDIGNRGPCVAPRCENEMGNKVLLVADGILQSVGVLQIVGGFVFPTKRTVTRTVGVHVTPTGGRSSIGVAAYGAF